MNFTLSYTREYKQKWHKWFAWHPIKMGVINHRHAYVWLDYVERKLVTNIFSYDYYDYRPYPSPPEAPAAPSPSNHITHTLEEIIKMMEDELETKADEHAALPAHKKQKAKQKKI